MLPSLTNEKRYCLFFDIDGTIARNEAPPSEKTVESLRALRRAGHITAICTGRTMCDIYPSLLKAGFDVVVAGAGCHVVADGEEIHHSFLPTELLRRTVQGMLDNRFSGVLEGTDNIWLVPGEVPLPDGWPVLRGLEDVDDNLKIEKFTIHTDGHAHIQKVFETMPMLPAHYECYPSNSGALCEFVLKGYNKAFGMDVVLRHYGIQQRHSIAFGDSMNDCAMLRHAGISVAMGDAPAEVQAMATYVTGTLEQEGVYTALAAMGLVDIQKHTSR